MRPCLILLCALLAACNPGQPLGDAARSEESAAAAPQAAAPMGPDVRHFSEAEQAAALDAGAGCGYRQPGMTLDSSLFASTTDAIIRVGGNIELLKLVDEGMPGDSATSLRYENAEYRVRVSTVVDSIVEGGVYEHGEMTVEDKRNGRKTTRAIEGGCGC